MAELEKAESRSAEDTGAGIMGLAALPMDAPIDRRDLARMLGKCETSIDRAVRRGELCRPVRIMGRPTWTRRAIMAHLEARLEQAQEVAAKRLRLAP